MPRARNPQKNRYRSLRNRRPKSYINDLPPHILALFPKEEPKLRPCPGCQDMVSSTRGQRYCEQCSRHKSFRLTENKVTGASMGNGQVRRNSHA